MTTIAGWFKRDQGIVVSLLGAVHSCGHWGYANHASLIDYIELHLDLSTASSWPMTDSLSCKRNVAGTRKYRDAYPVFRQAVPI